MYTYNAKITKIVDGDTVHAQIDLGFKVSIVKTIRLARIDCESKKEELGMKATEFLVERLLDKVVTLRTSKLDKYARYLGEIELNGENINDLLVTQGLAEYSETYK